MIRIDLPTLIQRLSPICRYALEEAASYCISQRGAEVTVAMVIFKLLDQPLGDVPVILKQVGVDRDDLRRALSSETPLADTGADQYPSFSPLLVEALQEAWLLGSLELGFDTVRGGGVLLATLLNAGRYLPLAAVKLLDGINREALRKRCGELLAQSAEAPLPATAASAGATNAAATGADTALAKYGHDLTARAREGRIDPVLCRNAEIDLMIDILSRRRKNNPILVGDAGVGKSAVVEGLALRIVQKAVPGPLLDVSVWGLDLGALLAGASVKGEFERRLKAVMDEVKAAPQPVILFIDEAHTLIGAGNAAGGSDGANLLKPALARGELRTIAATTWSEYGKYFEKDPALARRFQQVKLNEPSQEAAVQILRGLRQVYEQAHRVYIGDDALHAAVSLSARFLSGRQLPDKAIDVLDTACARVATALAQSPRRLENLKQEQAHIDGESQSLMRDVKVGRKPDPRRLATLDAARLALQRQVVEVEGAWRLQKGLVDEIVALRGGVDDEGDATCDAALAQKVAQLHELQRSGALLHADVGREQIAQVIADWTGIPATTINRSQVERLAQLPALLRERVKGQEAAIERLHRHLLTAVADLRRPGTPLGAFLLVGPSGVGKTETALAIADVLFGGKNFLTTVNMSEFQEKHTVSRLLGAPPGYVGHGEGGALTEAIRRQPYSVVLLDEVEKAHPDVLNVFYQAFDKGELADGDGRQIDCRNVLFLLTSNLGFDRPDSALAELPEAALRQRLLQFFKPALLARMQVIPYRYLDAATLGDIIDSRLQRLQQLFDTRYDARLDIDAAAREELRSRCVRHENGARLLDASIDGELLPPLSLAVLQRQADGVPLRSACLHWRDSAFVASLD